MKPRTRIGLIVGAIGAVLNVCVAGAFGICGPVLSLIAGAVAGFFAAQQERPFNKNEGGRIGATAGGIAGALVIIGQIIGSLGALLLVQVGGMPTIVGSAPSPSSDVPAQIIYYGAGVGTALCFGIVGAALAAGAGAGAGYLGTPEPAAPPPAENMMS
jgi:hypothetical protein